MMSVEDRLKAAARHKASGDTASAAALLETILDLAPGHCGALRALAELRFEAGDGDAALRLLNEVLSYDRTDRGARNLLAALLLARNDRCAARKLVEETLELHPVDSRGTVLRADIHLKDGEHVQAEDLLRRALADHPDDDQLLAALSDLLANQGKDRPALLLAQQALTLAPDDLRHLARLGCLLARSGAHDNAVPALEIAHLLLPKDPLVMLYLAESQAARGLLQEARTLAKRVTVRFPDFLAAWLLLIRIEAERGDTRKVFADFLLQIKQHPDRAAALISLAMAYRKLGYLSKPIRLLAAFLEKDAGPDELHRDQALTVLRDCMLASDSLDDLHKTVPLEIDNAGAPLSCSQPGTGCPKTILQALSEHDILIEPGLSSLEALVFLRFATHAPPASAQRILFAPSHLGSLTDLVDGFTFKALDDTAGQDVFSGAVKPVSLTRAISLPSPVLRRVRQTGAYVFPRPKCREKWQAALRDLPRPLVALAWNEHRGGLMLEDYQHLLDQLHGFNGTMLSVVWDAGRHQLADWPRIIDCGRHFETLSDLSAVLSLSDLLIGPDGMPMHVAGAMGRPAALLTQPAQPWYWHANNGRATWYPSVQVISTRKFGHWATLMAKVTEPLAATIHALQTSDAYAASS